MRLMFATDATNRYNPLFLEDEAASKGEADGTLRPADDDDIMILNSTLVRLLAERTTPSANISQAMHETYLELQNAVRLFAPFHSAHEAYGVVMEEVRELEEHIFMNQKKRNIPAMRKEACQIAAMAMRLMVDLC